MNCVNMNCVKMNSAKINSAKINSIRIEPMYETEEGLEFITNPNDADFIKKQCEFCLLGIKGKPIWTATDFRDIIREQKIKQHSAKPESFYTLVDKYCIGRKLDYFARKKREGWDVYGDEVNGK